jgi:hypothetical protein
MSQYGKSHPDSHRTIDDGRRDPSSHRTPEQIRNMDRGYNHTPEMRRRRAEQNKGRRILGLKKGDPRDAGHIKSLDTGGKTVKGNLEPQSQKFNRGWRGRGRQP